MIERDEWSQFDIQRGKSSYGAEEQAKYRVPYEWGALHISEEADESYGFVPLTAGVVSGAEDITHTENAFGLRTDIYLLSPEEFKLDIAEARIASRPYRTAPGVGATIFDKDRIKIILALHSSKQDVESRLLGNIESYVNYFGGEIEDVRTEDDIPIKESIGHDTTQFLVHSFCSLAAESTKVSMTEYLRAERNKLAVARFAKLGSRGLIGAGVAFSAAGAIHSGVEMIIPSAAVTYTAVQSWATYEFIKRHMRQANAIESQFKVVTRDYADMLSLDIHKTYCTTHFDMQAEKKFKNS